MPHTNKLRQAAGKSLLAYLINCASRAVSVRKSLNENLPPNVIRSELNALNMEGKKSGLPTKLAACVNVTASHITDKVCQLKISFIYTTPMQSITFHM